MRGRNSDPGNGMISGTNNDGSSHVAFGHLAVPNGNNNGRRYTTDGNLHDLNVSYSTATNNDRDREKLPRIRSHAGTKLSKLSRKLTKTKAGITSLRNQNTMTSDIEDLSDDELASLYSRSHHQQHTNYLSFNPKIGRNSTFVTLTEQQKEELGGVEYRSLKLLVVVLSCYYIGFHILALLMFLIFGVVDTHYVNIIRSNAVTPAWWGAFTSASAFNDLGFTLTVDSMVSFSQNAYILIAGSFFVVIGNTGFPVFLRFIIWVMRLFTRPLTLMHESLSFLLEHPRRCFTLLFPSGPTWWLFAVLVLLNGIDWVLFIILDFNGDALADTPPGYRSLI
ncbi:unnamed protein product [Ambrosiozyma monospora]|uniref:Unnamed protein product n=1 Tax=Ambrosiozyma monospora TaxID=43982 RepID=A0ACB5U4S6_AMBMO|nr:unnamed protein product [Ambrosiozyma monospora]